MIYQMMDLYHSKKTIFTLQLFCNLNFGVDKSVYDIMLQCVSLTTAPPIGTLPDHWLLSVFKFSKIT